MRPVFIVIHHTAMACAASALRRLCDPASEVSAHYLIDVSGGVCQLVAEEARAWHAGQGEWAGLDDINSRSIGIELDNRGSEPFSEPQMRALEALLRAIMERWDIPPDGVIGHSDMAPGRKQDPGSRFDWARLARQGLVGFAGGPRYDGAVSESAFVDRARARGFTAPCDTATLLATTRLRFAPWRSGPLVAADFDLHHGIETARGESD